MMRHLVKVMLVLEGKQPWARALRDRRRNEQGGGLPLPLPCVRRDDDDVLFCGRMRWLCEGVDKEIMRMIVSFI